MRRGGLPSPYPGPKHAWSLQVLHRGMAFPALTNGKSHGQVADAAELSGQYPRHQKVFCRLLLDIEDVGMAIVAVKPPGVPLMGKQRRRDVPPFGLELDGLSVIHVRGLDV